MSLIARAGALVFRGRRDVIRDGFYVDADSFTGWDDGVDVRRELYEIPQGHGAYDLPGFLEPRTFGWRGRCYANSEGRLEWWRGALVGLLAGGDSGQVIVGNRGLTTWANARLATRAEFAKIPGGALMARYRIQFWAANPRKFGDVRRHPDGSAWPFASGEPAYHYGNFAATPVHVVSGDMSGYTINGPVGKAKVVTVPVVAGHPHTIDDATGYLSIDGVIVVGGMSQADTWAIPAGAQVTHTLTPASGTGTLATTVLDTYL